MTFDPSRRIHQEELLDAGAESDADVRESLRDLARINAFLGGWRVLRQLLSEQIERTGLRRFSLLDIGTGSGELAASIVGWARSRGCEAHVTGLDRQMRHLQFGERNGWSPLCGDALALPFAPRTFDFVSASLFLHHFEDDAVAGLLRNLASLARHALLVNDLERNALAYHFIRFAPFFASSRVTRFDGAVSVQRAFRKPELQELASRAGLGKCRVRGHWPLRLSLVAEIS